MIRNEHKRLSNIEELLSEKQLEMWKNGMNMQKMGLKKGEIFDRLKISHNRIVSILVIG